MRVAVVGGGFAGIAAALDLRAAGAEVVLVERRTALGGRAYSYTDGKTGDVVDNGQHVLFGCYGETLALLDRLGSRGRLHFQKDLRIPYVGAEGETLLRAWPLPAPLHLAAGLLALGGLRLGEKVSIARAIRAIERLTPTAVRDLDQRSVLDWLRWLGQSDEAIRRFWEPLAVAALNERLELASARWLAATVRGVFLGGREGSRVVLPAVSLAELYVEPARAAFVAAGVAVDAGTGARLVHLDLRGRAVGVETAGGASLGADAVVLAVPHGEVAGLVPETLAAAPPFADLAALGSSPIVSVHLWLDREPSPHLLAGLLGSEMQWLFNVARIRGWSSAPDERGHVCLVASAAHDLAVKGRPEIEAIAIEELHRLFPGSRRARVDRAVAVVQRHATASLRPGLARLRPGAATPVPNLALAGDWTDPDLPATIEGAVRSGRRAAAHVLAGASAAKT